jgi:hypothetical protein
METTENNIGVLSDDVKSESNIIFDPREISDMEDEQETIHYGKFIIL